MIQSLIISGWTLIISFLFTLLFKMFVPRLSLDSAVVPRGAGIVFLVSFFLGGLFLYGFKIISGPLFLILMGGGSLVALVGLLDDLSYVNRFVRILVHFMAAIWVLSVFHNLPSLNLGLLEWTWHWDWIGAVICIIGMVWMINIYNFMDSVDGSVASEAIFVALAAIFLLFLKGNTELIPALSIFIACILGFLCWNWAPAHVIAGGAGSSFLGFILGAFVVITYAQGILMPWTWLILLAVFWVDATLTLGWRIVFRELWPLVHCNDGFKLSEKLIGSHTKIVLLVQMINMLWLLPLAILSIYFVNWGLALTLIAITPLIILYIRLKLWSQS